MGRETILGKWSSFRGCGGGEEMAVKAWTWHGGRCQSLSSCNTSIQPAVSLAVHGKSFGLPGKCASLVPPKWKVQCGRRDIPIT